MKEFLNEMAILVERMLVLFVEICCVMSLGTLDKNWKNFMIMKNDTSVTE